MMTLEQLHKEFLSAKAAGIKCLLVGCEESGKVREALKKRGHFAVSCDLMESRIPGLHYQGDVFDLLDWGWDGAIMFPPCTYLCNSGVRWLHTDITRWVKMFEGALFLKKLLGSSIPRIAIENPIMHKYAKAIIGRSHDQVIQPWMFGHGETKATTFFLKGFPPLKPTKIVDGRHGRIHLMAPGPERAKLRSETYDGVAEAIAEQWGA